MQESLINQGIELMVFGMGTVIIFLTSLVILTGIMSSLVQKLAPAPAAPVAKPGSSSQPDPAMDDAQLVAVISAAIKAHRARHK